MIAIAHRSERDATEKRCHFAPCLSFGKTLQQLAASIHQRYDIAGKSFPENKRRRHGKRRNDVEPNIAPAQRSDNLHEQCEQNGNRPKRPSEMGPISIAMPPEPAAHRQAKQRDENQQTGAVAPIADAAHCRFNSIEDGQCRAFL
ncbi:hypothetical protein HNQ36_002855 [Afipia massiliensis]|uniref:Uncharacterized protein n=1 Tax=Afipia massiliensis TaxID=211460 RepID=A0A840N2L2_9BRAD|nr:hypothetical protein [Afipia massiliensis]